jgi:exopolyphosphatase/guanosine-5'-triphosphate,3'-diphosphate pyrophosphatase
MSAMAALRWEWRTFGDEFGGAEERFRSIDPDLVTESDETYALSADSVDAVKVRNGLMDVKHLEEVDDDGLELWRPVMKAPLPISVADAEAVLVALRVGAALEPDTYDLGQLAAVSDGAVALVPLHKTRRHYQIEGCMAELTDFRVGGASIRTIAIESEEPARVIGAVGALGLASRTNTNVPKQLKSLV